LYQNSLNLSSFETLIVGRDLELIASLHLVIFEAVNG
jgi:hypothetical protein